MFLIFEENLKNSKYVNCVCASFNFFWIFDFNNDPIFSFFKIEKKSFNKNLEFLQSRFKV
jgi:hypothetical protein